MKKIVLILTTFFILAILAAAIWAYAAFFYTKPLTQSELKDLTPDWTRATQGNWSPWFTESDGSKTWNPTASFNAYLNTVPEEDKAWPVLIDVALANPELFKHEALGTYPDETEHWHEIVNLLESPEGKDAIAQLKDALTRPVLGCGMNATTETYLHQALLRHGLVDDNWNPNPDPNPNGLDILLPALGKLRNSANLLKSAAIYELINDNPDEFVEIVNALYTSAQLADETPIILGQLVRIAIKALANDLILWSLEEFSESFTDQHLAQLSSIIERAGIQTFIWEGEALFFRDSLRHMATGNGPINPTGVSSLDNSAIHTTPTSLPDAQLHSSLQRMFFVHTLIGKQAELRSRVPWDPTLEPSDDLYELQKDSLNEMGRLFMGILLPALDRAAARFQGIAQESIGTRTLIALHRHKLRHDRFPTTLNDIDPDLITFDPMDIFTGQPLHYLLTDQGPMVYALGHDRDDDNGRYDQRVLSITKPVDADWPMFSYHKLNRLYPDE